RTVWGSPRSLTSKTGVYMCRSLPVMRTHKTHPAYLSAPQWPAHRAGPRVAGVVSRDGAPTQRKTTSGDVDCSCGGTPFREIDQSLPLRGLIVSKCDFLV